MGKVLAALLVGCALLAGVGVWYLQVYAYYDTLPAQDSITLQTSDGPVTLPVRDFRAIDSDSSPLRYRACFTVAADLAEAPAYDDPTPLFAPGWFDCFDAQAIGADLEAGRARAILVAPDTPRYGIDRVMALYPDGRAMVWPQFNPCGTAFYDEDPLPPGCPPPPAR